MEWGITEIFLESFFVRPSLLPVVSFVPRIQDRINEGGASTTLGPSCSVFCSRPTWNAWRRTMTIGINILQRVVKDIAITVERLRIGRPRDNGIRTEEAPQLGVIPSGIVITQPLAAGQAAFVVLPSEAFGGQIAEGPAAIAAVGVVVVVCQRGAALIHKATTRLQVVLQQVEGAVLPYADALAVEAQQ